MITGLYAAILAFIQFIFAMMVVKVRRSNKISLGDGELDELQRKSRAYGNFTETVPMALLLMLIAEIGGASLFLIHVMGVVLIAARLIHHRALTSGSGHGHLRPVGMVLTFLVFILGSVTCLWLALFAS